MSNSDSRIAICHVSNRNVIVAQNVTSTEEVLKERVITIQYFKRIFI